MAQSSYQTAPHRIGLALSGGAAKGFAHSGVLHALEDNGIRPDIIAGTSAGALVAALYADGYRPEEIPQLFRGKNFRFLTEWQIPQRGVFSIQRFKSFLRSTLRHKNIEDLPLPIRIVATDLDHGVVKVFSQGPLVETVTASCSIPILFNPVEIDGTTYVDGGLFKDLPASVIREDCRYLIGVHLNPKEPSDYKKSLFGIAERCFGYIFRANSLPDRKLCDLLIESGEIIKFKPFHVEPAEEIAAFGYKMAKQVLKTTSITRNP